MVGLMADRHRAPGLSWHPPGELSAWARVEAQRRSVPLSVILTEALSDYRAGREQDEPEAGDAVRGSGA